MRNSPCRVQVKIYMRVIRCNVGRCLFLLSLDISCFGECARSVLTTVLTWEGGAMRTNEAGITGPYSTLLKILSLISADNAVFHVVLY
jgi:hypothetical protein